MPRHFVPILPPGVEQDNSAGRLNWNNSIHPFREQLGQIHRPSEVKGFKLKVTCFTRTFDMGNPGDVSDYNKLMSAVKSKIAAIDFLNRRLVERTYRYASGQVKTEQVYKIYVEYSFSERVADNV